MDNPTPTSRQDGPPNTGLAARHGLQHPPEQDGLAEAIFTGLNPEQRAAVETTEGPLLVLAGAGSGKTRVLTSRIAYLIGVCGIPADQILAVTFTNKAAGERKERVEKLLGPVASQCTIGTFHSIGVRILRREIGHLGRSRGFVIYDDADTIGVIKECLKSEGLDPKVHDPRRIRWQIDQWKNAGLLPPAAAEKAVDLDAQLCARLYAKYQKKLGESEALDFGDLLLLTAELFRRHPRVLQYYQQKWAYILVDEYQDTNGVQYGIVSQLAAAHRNLCVVGDPDQSIYAWRGADPTNILRFADMFEGATVVKLEQNYRSTRLILDAANAVIAHNTQRHGKTLWSEIPRGELITHAVAQDVEQESQWVAAEIKRVKEAGRSWQDIAVLYRSNLQAKGLEDELRQNGVPYVMYGGQEFFERKEVKDLIAYLRVALNPRDELSLRRIVNYPARGVGPTTVEKIVAWAAQRHTSMWDVLKAVADAGDGHQAALDEAGLRPGVRKSLAELVGIIDTLGAGLRDGAAVASTRKLIDAIALHDDLRDASPSPTAAQRRIDNVEGLLNSLTRFEARERGPDALGDYLRKLSLESGEEADTSGDKIVLTTLHGAKGLEFPVVFMVGLEEELLPHARTLYPQATDALDADHASDVSEERRLCYVGITRAQRKLYITRACTRVNRGRAVARVPSRFLLEIPDDLIEVKDLAEEARQKVPTSELRSFFASFGADD